MGVQNIVESWDGPTSKKSDTSPAVSPLGDGEYLLLRRAAEPGAAGDIALISRALRDCPAPTGGTPTGSGRVGPRSGRRVSRPLSGSDIREVCDVVISRRILSHVRTRAGGPMAHR